MVSHSFHDYFAGWSVDTYVTNKWERPVFLPRKNYTISTLHICDLSVQCAMVVFRPQKLCLRWANRCRFCEGDIFRFLPNNTMISRRFQISEILFLILVNFFNWIAATNLLVRIIITSCDVSWILKTELPILLGKISIDT